MLPKPAPRPRDFGRRWWIWLGVVPPIVLAASGFYAALRESQLALTAARLDASRQIQGLANRIAQTVFALPLASEPDVRAWTAHPTLPESEPLHRLSLAAPSVIAWLVSADGTYPTLHPPQPVWEPPEPASLLAVAWEVAVRDEARLPRSAECVDAWETVNRYASGTSWEKPAQFRLAASLARVGRTREAVALLEPLATTTRDSVGETGLPLEVLAYRTLLQIAALDPEFQNRRAAWFDRYSYAVLVRWRLSPALLSESANTPSLPSQPWKGVQQLHSRALTAISRLPSRATPTAPFWVEQPQTPLSLRMATPVVGGFWDQLWPADDLWASVARAIATLKLPEHLGTRVEIAGRSMPGLDSGPEVLATASADALPVLTLAVTLSRPDLIEARTSRRLWQFGALILLAGIAAVAAYLAALRAFERQRQLAASQADFVAAVSHELRAPLAAVSLLTEELTDLPATDDTRRQRYHSLILREVRRLGLLVDNVLRHARLERRGTDGIETLPVDLNSLLRETTETLRPSALERGVTLAIDSPEGPVETFANPQALTQIVVNLVDNAIKHAPPESQVRISLTLPPGPTNEPRRVRFAVEDKGPGIPKSDHTRIFEPFYRRGSELRRETPGVGLGLSIVQRLVQAHQGHVSVESQPGQGARFIVDLPLTTNN